MQNHASLFIIFLFINQLLHENIFLIVPNFNAYGPFLANTITKDSTVKEELIINKNVLKTADRPAPVLKEC